MAKSKLKKWLAYFSGIIVLLITVAWFYQETIIEGAAKTYFAGMQSDALAEPYRGIETSAGKVLNLFPLQATGVSTLPILEAATKFLNSLSEEQQQRTLFAVDDDEWRKWSNVDNGIYERQGVSLKELNAAQKEAAFALMAQSLSAKGLKLSKDIMKTDQTLREVKNGNPDYDEELYFLTIMGTPAENEPWGWQMDGHHLVINYFLLGDQVVMSPVFMGAEPVFTTSGKYKGNVLFQDEQNLGLAFMRALSAEHQKAATISNRKVKSNNRTEAFKDNVTIDYEGLSVSELPDAEKAQLLSLVALYVGNMREGHQQVKMEEVFAHIDNTWFAWVGETSEEAVFYYRIHSPVVLIEFDHQRPIGMPRGDGLPTRNHIHTVVRTPNGNDYGKDLLRQHLEKHPH